LQNTASTTSTERIKQLPLKKRGIKLIGRITFWCMAKISGFLRPWSVSLIGENLGSLFYILSRRYRRIAIKNLHSAFPEKSDPEVRSMAKQVFRHFTRGAIEFFYLLSLSKEQVNAMIDVEGLENLDAELAKGKGCVMLTAHYGNWELLARKMALLGYKINVIARDSDDPGMTGITTRIRESGGYKVFDRDQPIIGAFRALKKNELLGILPDQNESHGIFVEYFGRPVATATGPAVLSLRSGAPIVPIFAPRDNDNHYKATVYPRIEFTPSGDEEKDIHNLTALVNKEIEREVRSHPTQWLWLHDRWKLSAEAPVSAD
jgi:Kdo2-lipid IVA lauroyltransferase/acyltransferase